MRSKSKAKDTMKVQDEQASDGSVTLKCIPASKDSRGMCQVFLKCHFDYSSNNDKLFPKKETGLCFQKGDILEVIDQTDGDWWQAFRIDEPSKKGFIPSLRFEQERLSNKPLNKQKKGSNLFGKGNKKVMYRTCKSSMFDCFDVRLYEEVTKMPPVERKLIVLVGAQGVGSTCMKKKLLNNYPDRYGFVIPDTSREPHDGEQSGRGFNFISKEEMFGDIATGKYFEWGEQDGNYYGSKLDAIRDVISTGKICIVDCDSSALKFLRTAEFMPMVFFVEAPSIGVLSKNNQSDTATKKRTGEELESMIEESASIDSMYHHYFDYRVVNEDNDQTYEKLCEYIEQTSSESQWVPISWVY